MKVNTKLLINIFLPIGTALIIIVIMTLSMVQRNKAERKNTVALSLLTKMTELDQRTYYYLLYKEDRTKKEWFG